jgi:hypothetical protein
MQKSHKPAPTGIYAMTDYVTSLSTSILNSNGEETDENGSRLGTSDQDTYSEFEAITPPVFRSLRKVGHNGITPQSGRHGRTPRTPRHILMRHRAEYEEEDSGDAAFDDTTGERTRVVLGAGMHPK